MADLLLIRGGLSLLPADGLAEKDLARLPLNKPLLCTLKRLRSVPHNRLYHACLDRVVENLDQEVSAKALHEWLKLKLGYAAPIAMRNGAVEWVPESTAFDKMDEAEFRVFSGRAFDLIRTAFGIDPDDLKREGAELLGKPS